MHIYVLDIDQKFQNLESRKLQKIDKYVNTGVYTVLWHIYLNEENFHFDYVTMKNWENFVNHIWTYQ